MRNRSLTRTNITGFSFLAFVFGIVYIVGHLGEVADVMLAYVQVNERTYLNLGNFSYCFLCIAKVIFPFLIIYPHKDQINRVNSFKIVCYIIAISYFLANAWIVSWIASSIATGQWSFDVAQYQLETGMMFNHLEWTSRNAETIFYNYASCVLWFAIGYNFDRDRKLTCKYVVITYILKYVVPALFYYFYKGDVVPDWWLKKTVPVFCMEFLIMGCLLYAARSRETWKRYICRLKRHKKHIKTETTETEGKSEE